MAPFATGLCEYFAAQGHRVTSLTAFPYYPAWRVWDGYRGRLFQKEDINGVRVRRSWHFVPTKASNLLQRLAHDLSFAFSIFVSGLFVRNFEILCCVCPPPTVALASYVLAKIRRRPYIIILTDLASEAALATGILKDGPAVRMARKVERFGYDHADRVVCICPAFVEILKGRDIDPEKLQLIHLWGDTDNVYPIPNATSFRRANQIPDGAFLIMHTGNMGKKQNLMNVVRAAEMSRNIPDLVWLLVGVGEERTAIEEAINSRNLKNIHLLPLQPAEILAEMYSAADALLLNQKAAVVDSVIPSKLLTYMAAGRAIVASANDRSETVKYIERAQCGIIVHPEQPRALVDAVLALKSDATRGEHLGSNGRAYALQNFTKSKILQQYGILFSRYADQVPAGADASKKAAVTS